MLYRVHFAGTGFEFTTIVVISTDCTGSCKSNYYTISTTTVTYCLLEDDGLDRYNNLTDEKKNVLKLINPRFVAKCSHCRLYHRDGEV